VTWSAMRQRHGREPNAGLVRTGNDFFAGGPSKPSGRCPVERDHGGRVRPTWRRRSRSAAAPKPCRKVCPRLARRGSDHARGYIDNPSKVRQTPPLAPLANASTYEFVRSLTITMRKFNVQLVKRWDCPSAGGPRHGFTACRSPLSDAGGCGETR